MSFPLNSQLATMSRRSAVTLARFSPQQGAVKDRRSFIVRGEDVDAPKPLGHYQRVAVVGTAVKVARVGDVPRPPQVPGREFTGVSHVERPPRGTQPGRRGTHGRSED